MSSDVMEPYLTRQWPTGQQLPGVMPSKVIMAPSAPHKLFYSVAFQFYFRA